MEPNENVNFKEEERTQDLRVFPVPSDLSLVCNHLLKRKLHSLVTYVIYILVITEIATKERVSHKHGAQRGCC